jgi:hypothetical protein
MTSLSYFAQHGKMTHPGVYASSYAELPSDIPTLVHMVQGLIVHVFWAERYGLKLTPTRQAEVQLRSMERRLARAFEMDPAPLNVERSLEKKIVGNCRDFSLTLASLLQTRGIPARPRCGFGAYFLPDHYEDHWVCEYWNEPERRWVLVDAQLDDFQQGALGIAFDALDVPRDQFLVGGAAWEMCRSGGSDPELFGIFDMHGIDFVKGNLIRDVAALNKVELLPWDCWGLILAETASLPPDDLSLLDRLASVTRDDVPDFDAVRQLYDSEPRLRVGESIQSFVNGKMEAIQL